ncbi:MAG: hypothetical protein AAF539_16005 [Planctomycetota bacterium]
MNSTEDQRNAGDYGTPRPLLTSVAAADDEAAVRKRLAYERACAMEACLQRADYTPGTSYWDVAVVLAKSASGWLPIVWELDRIAEALPTTSDNPASRRRIVRRVLSELSRDGILTAEVAVPEGRRGRGAKAVATITIDREVVIGQKPLSERSSGDQLNGTLTGTLTRTETGHSPGQKRDTDRDRNGTLTGTNRDHTVLTLLTHSHSPHSPGCRSASVATDVEVDQKSIGDGEVVHVADSSGDDISHLARIEPTAINVAAALRWPPGDARTIWQVAAAHHAGQLSDAEVAAACRVAVMCAKHDRIGYMRTKLAERLGVDLRELSSLLSRVLPRCHAPRDPPVRRNPVPPTMTTNVKSPPKPNRHDSDGIIKKLSEVIPSR